MTENATQSDSVVDNAPEGESTSNNQKHVVKRLVGQREKLRENNSSLNTENNELISEVARLTTQVNELKTQKSSLLPTAEQFGDDNAGYVSALNEALPGIINQAVEQRLNTFQQNQASQNEQARLDSVTSAHYAKVEEFNKPDYGQAESNVLSALGQDTLNQIAGEVDNSHELIYMLGNDPAQLQNMASMFATNPLKATLQLGRLSANAGSFNKETRPEPETVLTGGQTPSVPNSNLQKAYDKELEAVASGGGDNTRLRELRKQLREAGHQI